MVLASPLKVVLGSIAFLIFWVLAVFPAIPFLPVGRTAGSLIGAMLMVIFGVATPDQAYAAIDLPILGLLFGTMVVSVYLERADMFKYLGELLSWKSKGPKDLLIRICLISAISSALFTNDTSCVVLTGFVIKISRQHNLPPHPFLLALASSANIGSSATPIGNPQNLVIAIQSKISFSKFLLGVLPSMLVGLVVNTAIIMCMYWKLLSSTQKDVENAIPDEDANSHRFSPAVLSHFSSFESFNIQSSPNMNGHKNHSETLVNITTSPENEVKGGSFSGYESAKGSTSSASKEASTDVSSSEKTEESVDKLKDVEAAVEKQVFPSNWKRIIWKSCAYLITLCMLVSLLMGLNMSWTAISAALALVALDFKDAQPCFDKVSYSLLIFFCGMFITVDGVNRTGIPRAFWELMEPHAQINSYAGVAVLAIVILILSNLVSNVPTVLLLGGRVAASAAAISAADEKKSWLILAWVSTVAGNLSLLGSAANLIVCEQARQAQPVGYNLTFWKHIKFGVPSTIIVTAVGLMLIR